MKKLFVGNIPHSTTEAELRALFEPHGAIEQVSIVTDRDTGRSRGFAFVEMTDSAEAEKAIAALNGKELGGRALNINEARPKTDRGGPPAVVAVDVRAVVVDAPVVAVDVPVAVVVGVTIIRAMRVSLESRAGKEQHSVVHCRVLRAPICQKNVPWRCLCLVEAVPASPSVRKSAHGRKSRRKKAERKVQRKLEKPATGSDSFELSEEDFAAAAAQMALPGDSHLEE